MKHIAAFALLVLGGNEKPTAADVEKFLKDSGVKADSENIKRMIDAFEGKNFHELVQGGLEKMSSMGSSAAAAPAGGAAKVEVVDAKKEEEEEVDMGGLFGDEDDGY